MLMDEGGKRRKIVGRGGGTSAGRYRAPGYVVISRAAQCRKQVTGTKRGGSNNRKMVRT